MADWGNVQQGLLGGYQIGRSAGGRRSNLGSIIAKVADRLRSQRETGEEMGRKLQLLGLEETSKVRLLEKEAELTPKEWKPKTKAEAIEFEQEKEKARIPSYADQFRMDLQNAGIRIQSGGDVKTVTNELIQKYPGSMTSDIIFNLKEVGKNVPKKTLPPHKPAEVQEWSQVPVTRRILSAITPSATPEEQKLGGLRMGGIFKSPVNRLRNQAIDALKSINYPLTEANIKAAMEQVRNQ